MNHESNNPVRMSDVSTADWIRLRREYNDQKDAPDTQFPTFRAYLEQHWTPICTHPNLAEAETQKGDCACGCRDYKFCPDCEDSVDIDDAYFADINEIEELTYPEPVNRFFGTLAVGFAVTFAAAFFAGYYTAAMDAADLITRNVN